mgnify:CR=1 FL=1
MEDDARTAEAGGSGECTTPASPPEAKSEARQSEAAAAPPGDYGSRDECFDVLWKMINESDGDASSSDDGEEPAGADLDECELPDVLEQMGLNLDEDGLDEL